VDDSNSDDEWTASDEEWLEMYEGMGKHIKSSEKSAFAELKKKKKARIDKSKKGKSKNEPELYDIATPKLEFANATIYVISLDSSEGNKRKAQLNYEHAIFEAYPHTSPEPDIIQVLGRAQEHTGTAPRQRACFFSHFKLWQKIAEGNLNTIICEDDALLVRDIDLTTFSDDCITLLGGCIRTPGAWCREKSEFVENLKFLNIVKNFKPGLNIIDYDEYKWTNCLAYYLPANIARKLVSKVMADHHKVRPVDIWLGQTGFVQQLFFPNIFIDMDDSVTQVNSPKGHQKADFYICEFMRKEAMKQDIRLSMRGSSSLLGEP
jgi:GR25 family glycosyltransferase involved in LPS biosynthesis